MIPAWRKKWGDVIFWVVMFAAMCLMMSCAQVREFVESVVREAAPKVVAAAKEDPDQIGRGEFWTAILGSAAIHEVRKFLRSRDKGIDDGS